MSQQVGDFLQIGAVAHQPRGKVVPQTMGASLLQVTSLTRPPHGGRDSGRGDRAPGERADADEEKVVVGPWPNLQVIAKGRRHVRREGQHSAAPAFGGRHGEGGALPIDATQPKPHDLDTPQPEFRHAHRHSSITAACSRAAVERSEQAPTLLLARHIAARCASSLRERRHDLGQQRRTTAAQVDEPQKLPQDAQLAVERPWAIIVAPKLCRVAPDVGAPHPLPGRWLRTKLPAQITPRHSQILITTDGRQPAIHLHEPGVIVVPRLPRCGTAAAIEAANKLEPRVQRAARHPPPAGRATEHASGNTRHVLSA